MKITLLCVGKLGKTEEGRIALDYAARATATGRAHGLGPVEIIEAEESALLEKADGAYLIACDEHGKARSSRDFATHLERLRDDGERRLVFVIGAADGLGPRVLAAAREALAFGPQTWPHALARVMLAEQIYRATTLMARLPYHRD